MARLDARWDNFWHRGQAWYGFDMDGPSGGPSTVEGSFPVDAVVLATAQEALGADATLRTVLSSSLTADAVLRGSGAATLAVDAILRSTIGESFQGDAVLLVTGAGSYAVDADLQTTQTGQWVLEATKRAVIESGGDVDAVLRGVHLEDFTADAAIGVVELGSFSTDACLSVTTTGDVSLDAVVLAHLTSSFSADAIVGSGGAVVTDAFDVDAIVAGEVAGSFSVDAFVPFPEGSGFFDVDAWVQRTFTSLWITKAILFRSEPMAFAVDAAIFDTIEERTGSFRVKALLDDKLTHTFAGDDGWPIDAYIDSMWGEQFTLDALIVGTEKTASFAAGADISLAGEVRGNFGVDALLRVVPKAIFNVYATIVQVQPFTVAAIISPCFRVDAVLGLMAGYDSFSADSVIGASYEGGLTADAVLADAAGDYRGFHADSVVQAARYGEIEVVANIVGSPSNAFSVDAFLAGGASISAFIQPYFTVGAYIMGTNIVVYPPSQSGNDGVSLSGDTFYSPSASFDPTVTGIIIEGTPYAVTSVIDGNTVVVSPDIEVTGSGLDWSIPSGSPTDPLENALPVITRRFRVRIEAISPPDRGTATDLTPDVMWAQTEFTQAARFGPGSFRITLRGSFDLSGGEEIHVEIDDFRVFGGYVLQVEHGYVFSDAYNEATTTLVGTDYNILFDRLIVYNEEWVKAHGSSGEYRNWRAFPKGTSDRTIIRRIVRENLIDMTPRGFDFDTYVDEIDTPAPERPWAMQAGTKFREVMQSISMITGGVWWIDAYKNLHYHDDSTVTAPWPITDGDGGIASRNLKVTSDISPMISDAFVWGTLAYTTAGEIMFARQPADANDGVRYWERKIERLQPKIDRIKLIAPDKRTLRQKTDLAAYLKTLDIYLTKLARAQRAALENLPQGIYGRWQYAEMRTDIHHQDWLNRRAKAMFWRYSVPVIKAEATVFDLGFGAGQVASVVSSAHGISDELVIRQMTIKFVVGKEPFGGHYYAVPQFDLSLGLDPLSPWDVYDYLPFPGRGPDSETRQRKFVRGGDGIIDETPPDPCDITYGWVDLDTFDERTITYPADYYGDWGNADNERDEERPWTYPGGGSG